jgi:hypothetical protein
MIYNKYLLNIKYTYRLKKQNKFLFFIKKNKNK